jgi:uncharacterized protein
MDVLEKLNRNGITISFADIEKIARKYDINELSVFGSALRNDFDQESDIDFLIEFKKSENISLIDIIEIKEYLESITKRRVDIVEPAGLKNPYRKEAILRTREILYVA